MNEETENPDGNPSESAFRRLSSENTWTSNGNGVAQVHRNAANRSHDVAPDCDLCNDSLWVLAESGESGVLSVVPCSCQPVSRDFQSQLKTYSQLGHLERMTFDVLVPEDARDASTRLCSAPRRKPQKSSPQSPVVG